MKQFSVYFALFACILLLSKDVYGLTVECPSRTISLPQDDQEVMSENYGDEYGFGINCSLTITADPGKTFVVELKDLDIQPDTDAVYEGEIKVFKCKDNMVVIDFGKERYERCGRLYEDKPETFVSTGNTMTIHFITQKEESYKRNYYRGFLLTYKAQVDGESICPGRHIKKKRSGTLFSPGFPGNYGNNLDCRVAIPIPDNFQMNVWFSDFSLQNSLACRNDWLTIKDEHGGHRMCAGGPNRLPPLREMKASLARFHFRSDGAVARNGFRMHYNMTRLKDGHCMCTPGSSFICMMNFNKKVRRLWHRIKFSIRTTQTTGLIMFAKGTLRDYIYIGIRDGKIFYRSDLGTGSSSVVANDAKVNDGRWHKVEIRRRKRSLSVTVDNGRAEATSKTRGNFNKIDLPESVGFFLGTPPELNILPNFFGCIQDFTVDGREPLTNAYVSKPQYPSSGMENMSVC